MLKGKELGQAIKKAIELKLELGSAKSKTEIARHFDVRLPSVYDWINKGSISKDKLTKLFDYFSDVAGPQHWGIPDGSMLQVPSHDTETDADVELKLKSLLEKENSKQLRKLKYLLSIDIDKLDMDQIELLKKAAEVPKDKISLAKKLIKTVNDEESEKNRSKK